MSRRLPDDRSRVRAREALAAMIRMQRAEMIRRIGAAARRTGVEWRLVREGREHELWQCGPIGVAVPRNREIGEKTVRRIMADLEPILGRRWWQS